MRYYEFIIFPRMRKSVEYRRIMWLSCRVRTFFSIWMLICISTFQMFCWKISIFPSIIRIIHLTDFHTTYIFRYSHTKAFHISVTCRFIAENWLTVQYWIWNQVNVYLIPAHFLLIFILLILSSEMNQLIRVFRQFFITIYHCDPLG